MPLRVCNAPREAGGTGRLAFARSGSKTVVSEAFATSPLRLLMPRNHGNAAWVFLASLGGGLVDGDRIDLRIDADPETSAFIGTQASTKVYRSPRGCSQRMSVRAGSGAAVAIVPDPIVCFAGARYAQEIHATLAPDASLLLLDGYTCGRAARGERWQLDRLLSRIIVVRDKEEALVDATLLDPRCGELSARMAGFGVLLTLIVLGPRFSAVREQMLAEGDRRTSRGRVIVAPSPVGPDGALLRVAADHCEIASATFRESFATLSRTFGDNPFARKW